MKSLRGRLIRTLLAGWLILLAIGGTALYAVARVTLTARFDAALKSEAESLALLVAQDEGRLELEVTPEFFPKRDNDVGVGFLQIWHASGLPFAKSPSLGARDLEFPGTATGRPECVDVGLPNGHAGRRVAYRFDARVEDEASHLAEPGPAASAVISPRHAPSRAGAASQPSTPALPPEPFVLVIARSRRDIDGPLSQLFTALAVAGVLLGLGVVVVVRMAVQDGLKPLEDLGISVRAIDAATLDARLPCTNLPAELAPICDRLNDLLARLESSFERERSFTSAAAHELRTPLSEIRALTEVAIRFPGDPTEVDSTLRSILAASRRMQDLAQNLLALARARAGVPPACDDVVEAGALLRSAWASVESRASARGITWQLEAPTDASVRTNGSMLGAIFSNLLSNAVEHAPEATAILCRVAPVADGVAVSIANARGSLTEADLPHLFEPFWRKDGARTGGDHAGLGLAIVAAFAKALGIRISAVIVERTTFTLTLHVPAMPGVGDALTSRA